WRLIEMPAALLPASSVAMTAGGDAFRSMTDTRVSGTVLVGSLGSTLLDEPTSARLSSGVSATLRGGPTTLPGAAISATTRGGAERMPVPATHHVSGRPMTPPFPAGMQTAIFGLGCFWGAEKAFWLTPGVFTTAVGYAAGLTPNPTYEEVCTGRTGHNEVVL